MQFTPALSQIAPYRLNKPTKAAHVRLPGLRSAKPLPGRPISTDQGEAEAKEW